METTPVTQQPLESRSPKNFRPGHCQTRLKSVCWSFLCLLLTAAFAGVSSAQTLQSAGDLILNLQSVDLNGTSVWTNQTVNINSVGNMTTRNGSPLNVASVAYGAGSINALFVNQTAGNAVQSANQAPVEILTNAPYSGEAWIYAVSLAQQDVMSYGFEGGSAAPAEVRDMGYFNQGYGAFTGNFGNADSGWNPQATSGVWHYLAWTYDGTHTRVYQDAVESGTGGNPLNTQPSLLDVGCNISGQSPFTGYIACARIESGVLTASQITNNFLAGPTGGFGLVANRPVASPGTNVYLGDTVTLTELAEGTGSLTYQWYSDNGTGGATFSQISGQTATNYVLSTSTLAGSGTYQYEVVVTGGTTVTSSPVIIKVNPASGPIISQNITPATTSNLFVGSTITFSASFVGNQTITTQWQKSTDNGATFQNLSGDTNATLTLADLQLTDSGEYRLVATNGIGNGVSSAAVVNVQPLSALPVVQVAGALLAEMVPGDLSTNLTIWTNEIGGIGNFSTVSGLNVTVSNMTYNYQPINTLAVDSIDTNAMNSAQEVPTGITGNGTVSVESWIYPLSLNSGNGNNTVVCYGVQGGSALAPMEDREFDFGASGGSAFSGDFGNLDTGWSSPLTVNTWHYVAYTWDGSAFRGYLDGVLNVTHAAGPAETVQTTAVIGAGVLGTSDTLTGRTDPFNGNIAAVRISTGVLSASQIANNFIAGPLAATLPIVLSAPTISPTNVVFYGASVEVSVTNAQSLQTLTYQWQSDNGSGGVTWSNVTGQTDTNYSFSTTSLPRTSQTANYEYRLVATGSGGSVLTSAVATLTVKPAGPPVILVDTTPDGIIPLFVGQQITFTAGFTGNQPITNQWQVSTNGGGTFSNIPGATDTNATSSYSLTNLQLGQSAQYRLNGSNPFGSSNSTPARVYVLPLSSAPVVQYAGEVIADLESSGLDTNAGLWHNSSTDSNSVGDFTYVGTVGPLNETNVTYNFQSLNVLNVAGNFNNAVEVNTTTPATPSILLGANPCSMEAWVYATVVLLPQGGNCVVNYGDTYTNSPGNQDRAMSYSSTGYGAFTGYFGNADFGWNSPTADAWHYIAVTYDGNTVTVYQDSVQNGSRSGITLDTVQAYISVGSGTGSSLLSANSNPFNGYIAAARVETGVLTAKQIEQNYQAGPAPGLATGLSIAQLAPLTFGVTNGTLTLSWLAGTLQETTNLNGAWTTDSGVTSPYTVTPATSGVPQKFYQLKY